MDASTPRVRDDRRSYRKTLVVVTAFALTVSLSLAMSPSRANIERSADAFLVVDCLLPSQVRQLGRQYNYLAPRRPIKTTASDCEIRGGEYVAYDRANYATALKIWLPPAEQGDPAAQTYVGEIFEKGLGTAPDYAAAVKWYEKAAAKDYNRALINLGFLYEQGLGVPRNPAKALDLYRRAAGLKDAIALDGEPVPSAEEVRALREELDRTRRELEKVKREYEREQEKSRSEIERLTQQKEQAAAAGNTAETRRLEALLMQRETELRQQADELARLEKSAEDFRARLQQAEGETAALRRALDEARGRLTAGQREIEQQQQQVAETERQLKRLQEEAARQRKEEAAAAQARIAALDAELKQREGALAQQKAEVAELENTVKANQEKLARLEQSDKSPPPGVAVAGPSVQLIDPPVVLTRGPVSVKVRGGLKARAVVGRVAAPAGLLSFTVNDIVQTVDGAGLFKTEVDLARVATPVKLVAVDRQGKSAVLEFLLEEEGLAASPPPKPVLPPLDFGNYHALVIGNRDYPKLPRLDTPVADAKEVARILKEKYRFDVTLLLNATRYEILSELNKLRAKLTEKDNLLIYYAGHGELDRANLRGHWLPVDAEPDNNANWISSVAITDILNAMSVKHVLVVADSCYSGAMTRASIGRLESGMTDDARLNWLKAIANARSRTALTSGGLRPVLDAGGGRHSVFAQQFINILNENRDVMEAQRLYRELAARVLDVALKYKFDQRPEYAPLRFAGHESGDFLFAPVN